MDTLLVAGIDTVAGANIAEALSDRYEVIGLSFSKPVSISNCLTGVCSSESAENIEELIASHAPDWLIYCGPTAVSSWEVNPTLLTQNSLVEKAQLWASTAETAGCRFTAISSDAVFTGPWMFHTEESNCFCDSAQANNILKMEDAIFAAHSSATIIRTHVFGWAPEELGEQSINKLIQKLESAAEFPGVPHASPIFGTQLADIMAKLDQNKFSGLCHVGSAERVNPAQFAAHLAIEFSKPAPVVNTIGVMVSRPDGFAQGETSLQCTKIRKILGIGLPLISDGLRLLAIQHEKRSETYPLYKAA